MITSVGSPLLVLMPGDNVLSALTAEEIQATAGKLNESLPSAGVASILVQAP